MKKEDMLAKLSKLLADENEEIESETIPEQSKPENNEQSNTPNRAVMTVKEAKGVIAAVSEDTAHALLEEIRELKKTIVEKRKSFWD